MSGGADVVVRRMRAEDRAQVLALLARWGIAPVAPSRETPVSERPELLADNMLVAVDGERIVGTRSWVPLGAGVAEGASLALDPAYQGRGIGERLMLAGYRDMYAAGIRTVRSEADRADTIRWFVERWGYRVVGTRPKHHAFGAADADHWTVIELDLDTVPELADLRSGENT